jgi:hypothetical protein
LPESYEQDFERSSNSRASAATSIGRRSITQDVVSPYNARAVPGFFEAPRRSKNRGNRKIGQAHRFTLAHTIVSQTPGTFRSRA